MFIIRLMVIDQDRDCKDDNDMAANKKKYSEKEE
jgi:hypothetical protein